MARKEPIHARRAGTRGLRAHMDGSGVSSGDTRTPSPHRPEAATTYAGNPLLSLVTREDGWLRIVPARDSESVYIKWKFTHGPHARCYVMAVVQYWQMGYGLALMVDKLDAVDAGKLKPTLDTPYSD